MHNKHRLVGQSNLRHVIILKHYQILCIVDEGAEGKRRANCDISQALLAAIKLKEGKKNEMVN